MNTNSKSVWDDISRIWGRVAGVLAAVGLVATAVVKVFHTPPEFTYIVFMCIGLVLLIISFYVDKQAEYNHQEILVYESKARQDFMEVMQKARQQTLEMKQDSNDKIDKLTQSVNKILTLSEDTRRDTLRIQLLMILAHQPDNIDTILKLAQAYFVELKGDWYMTSEFNKWAKAHGVEVPQYIINAIQETHSNK